MPELLSVETRMLRMRSWRKVEVRGLIVADEEVSGVREGFLAQAVTGKGG